MQVLLDRGKANRLSVCIGFGMEGRAHFIIAWMQSCSVVYRGLSPSRTKPKAQLPVIGDRLRTEPVPKQEDDELDDWAGN